MFATLVMTRKEFQSNFRLDIKVDQHYGYPNSWRRIMNALKFVAIALFIDLAFSPPLAGQQHSRRPISYVRPYTSVDDILNREARASDPAGIQQYSEDLIGMIVPDQAGENYIESLASRLAKVEQMTREGKGKLIPEAEIVRVFNDLMKKIGAPPTFKADEAGLRQFRARDIVIQAFPALLSANSNGTNCNPSEAVYLLHLLLWNDGILSEHLLDDLATFKREAEQKNRLSVMSAGSVPLHQGAGVLLSDYSLHHHRHATIKLFNGMARSFGF